MKKITIVFLILSILSGGCAPIHVSLLSNNNLFTTRSQATGIGDAEGLVEGGGHVAAEVDLAP
jgi:hypothetical protein